MDEVRLTLMRPAEITGEREKLPLIFLPIGLLEWHGPHLPLGVDGINAERVAVGAAHRIGGVVLPTFYIGTERKRTRQDLASYDLEEAGYVEGMDFPGLPERSYYWREEIFGLIVRAQIVQAIERGYRIVCIINGHGAPNQADVLNRLKEELNQRYPEARITWFYPFPEKLLQTGSLSHAAYEETSLMLYYHPELVNLERLPSEGPLPYKEFAIVDAEAFRGRPAPGYAAREEYDPRRKSSVETGRNIFETTLSEITDQLSQLISELGLERTER
ncbi:MAG: creatininase family protein [Spirochaetia bacterium]